MMRKLYSVSSACILTMGVTLSCWAQNPCMPIAQDCMQQGYTQGGGAGKSLVKDCVEPIVTGQKTLPNKSYDLQTLQACQTLIQQKKQQQQ